MKRKATKPTPSPADAILADLQRLQEETDAKRARHAELGKRLARLEFVWDRVSSLGGEGGWSDPDGSGFLGMEPGSPRTAGFLNLWADRFMDVGQALTDCGQADRLDELRELVADDPGDEGRRHAKELLVVVLRQAIAGERALVHDALSKVFGQWGMSYSLFRIALGRFGKASWRWYKMEVHDPETQPPPKKKKLIPLELSQQQAAGYTPSTELQRIVDALNEDGKEPQAEPSPQLLAALPSDIADHMAQGMKLRVEPNGLDDERAPWIPILRASIARITRTR